MKLKDIQAMINGYKEVIDTIEESKELSEVEKIEQKTIYDILLTKYVEDFTKLIPNKLPRKTIKQLFPNKGDELYTKEGKLNFCRYDFKNNALFDALENANVSQTEIDEISKYTLEDARKEFDNPSTNSPYEKEIDGILARNDLSPEDRVMFENLKREVFIGLKSDHYSEIVKQYDNDMKKKITEVITNVIKEQESEEVEIDNIAKESEKLANRFIKNIETSKNRDGLIDASTLTVETSEEKTKAYQYFIQQGIQKGYNNPIKDKLIKYTNLIKDNCYFKGANIEAETPYKQYSTQIFMKPLTEMENLIKEKNLNIPLIREKYNEYKKGLEKFDAVYEGVKKDFADVKLFPSNMDCSRTQFMPPKYRKDYKTLSIMNYMWVAMGSSLSSNISINEMYSNPYSYMLNRARKYIDKDYNKLFSGDHLNFANKIWSGGVPESHNGYHVQIGRTVSATLLGDINEGMAVADTISLTVGSQMVNTMQNISAIQFGNKSDVVVAKLFESENNKIDYNKLVKSELQNLYPTEIVSNLESVQKNILQKAMLKNEYSFDTLMKRATELSKSLTEKRKEERKKALDSYDEYVKNEPLKARTVYRMKDDMTENGRSLNEKKALAFAIVAQQYADYQRKLTNYNLKVDAKEKSQQLYSEHMAKIDEGDLEKYQTNPNKVYSADELKGKVMDISGEISKPTSKTKDAFINDPSKIARVCEFYSSSSRNSIAKQLEVMDSLIDDEGKINIDDFAMLEVMPTIPENAKAELNQSLKAHFLMQNLQNNVKFGNLSKQDKNVFTREEKRAYERAYKKIEKDYSSYRKREKKEIKKANSFLKDYTKLTNKIKDAEKKFEQKGKASIRRDIEKYKRQQQTLLANEKDRLEEARNERQVSQFYYKEYKKILENDGLLKSTTQQKLQYFEIDSSKLEGLTVKQQEDVVRLEKKQKIVDSIINKKNMSITGDFTVSRIIRNEAEIENAKRELTNKEIVTKVKREVKAGGRSNKNFMKLYRARKAAERKASPKIDENVEEEVASEIEDEKEELINKKDELMEFEDNKSVIEDEKSVIEDEKEEIEVENEELISEDEKSVIKDEKEELISEAEKEELQEEKRAVSNPGRVKIEIDLNKKPVKVDNSRVQSNKDKKLEEPKA